MAEGKGGRLVEKTTKTHAERRVGLDGDTVEVLRGHRRQVDKVAEAVGVRLTTSAFVFTRRVDGWVPLHPNDATAAFRRLCGQLDIGGVRLHDLRHFAATRLLAAGLPVRQVSGRLGHAQASTTLNFYAHAVAELDAVAAEVLAALLRTGASATSP
jgi:integrase